ncbi:MAG TPA: mechanosensitive ion channel protein MscS [Porticoccaceae bacterium]|nr:mechanosensitive ion channel protein MscS [Porticoccaceae bacterium]
MADTTPEQDAAPDSQTDSLLEEVLEVDEIANYSARIWDWIQTDLLSIDVGIQLGLIFAALIPAAVFGPRIQKHIRRVVEGRLKTPFGIRLVNSASELATPIALYVTLAVVRIVLGSAGRPSELIGAAVALLTAWIVVRLVTLIIQSEFWSRVAFFIAWPIAALDVFGALGPIVEQMRELAIPLGENSDGEPIDISLLDVVRTLFYFLILFWAANFINRLLQQRILGIEDLSPSLKAMIGKILNVVMPVVALLIAFQIVGFNLATLAVFSGAVGLGIGLGLQRVVSNFVAGFTLLADRSIKPNDVIEIEDTFGWVTSMQARYVALRTRDGTEHLIPNDRFITEGVINWSRSDRNVRLHAPFGVTYATKDLRRVQALATEAASVVDRVVADPKPVCNVVEFGDSSINFDLRFWITDPQNGMANVRSEVYIGVWEALAENNIEIPFPQRDLHIRSWSRDAAPPAGDAQC